MAQFPANCNIGDTYFIDYPLFGVLDPFWVADNSQLIGVVTTDTLVESGSPVAYRNSNYAFAVSVIRAAGMSAVSSQLFTTFQVTVNFEVKKNGVASGSQGYGYIKIGTNLFLQFTVNSSDNFVYNCGSTAGAFDILTSTNAGSVGTSPFVTQFTHTFKFIRATASDSIIKCYLDGVLLFTYDSGITGAKSIYLQTCYYNNTSDWDTGGSLGHKVNVSYSNLYLIGPSLANACLGPTPDPFPERANSAFPGNPAACVLGKKTSYFLEEFISSTLPSYWNAIQGAYYAINGYATLPTSTPASQVMELKWVGKLLNFDPLDVLTLQVAGRLDVLNLGTGTSGYDAFGIKFFFPDLANWVLIKLQRDPTNSLVYRVRVSESFGSERTILTPAFSGYPLEMTLRLDISASAGVIYYVNGVNISSVGLPSYLVGVPYVLPSVFVGCDTVHRGYLYYFYVSGSPGFPNLCEGPSSSRIVSYRNMLINLLPLGFPWRNLNQLFRMFLTAFGVEFDRVHTRADDILRESNPKTATLSDLLTDWENMALLPEEMPVGTETTAQREAVVGAKVTTHYTGQSRQFFIDLAASLGIPIEIQETGISSSSRSGVARSGTSRIGAALNVFIWNIRILTDTFAAATSYWTFDGSQDFTTYPGSVTVKSSSSATDLIFVGGPLSPAFPIVPMSVTYPLKIRFQMRTFFNGATNRAFSVFTWAEAVDFSTDFVTINFGYFPGTPGYFLDMSGIRSGIFWSDLVIIPATHTDPLYGNFDFLYTISTTGFQIEIPTVGFIYTITGFLFPNIRFLDLDLQRADASNFAVLDGARVYTDAPNPASPLTKFQTMVQRLKPSHTQVTYS